MSTWSKPELRTIRSHMERRGWTPDDLSWNMVVSLGWAIQTSDEELYKKLDRSSPSDLSQALKTSFPDWGKSWAKL